MIIALRPIIHGVLHVAVPGLVARLCFRDRWRWAWGVMLLTLVVDLDHLLAVPVYDPNRCSIGTHPLHTLPVIGIYAVMAAIPWLRLVGFGLLIHMGLDVVDCFWMELD